MPTDPVVLLPGMGCSPRLWEAVATALRDDGHDVVDEVLDEPDLGRCVDALLAKLPDRFALAGLSLGGILAMAVARTAPHRVSRLCLAATNARPPTRAQLAAWSEQRARLAAGGTARELQRELLPVLVGRDASRHVVDATLAMAEEVGEARLDRQLHLQASRVDERPGLRGLEVPTLVLAGAADALCPLERHEEIHQLVQGSRLTVLDATPHLLPLVAPERVTDALRSWLRAPVVSSRGAARRARPSAAG
jgi:pimeloyl-ACP methyl ester carboxylesterase